jgi:hypothetical protein
MRQIELWPEGLANELLALRSRRFSKSEIGFKKIKKMPQKTFLSDLKKNTASRTKASARWVYDGISNTSREKRSSSVSSPIGTLFDLNLARPGQRRALQRQDSTAMQFQNQQLTAHMAEQILDSGIGNFHEDCRIFGAVPKALRALKQIFGGGTHRQLHIEVVSPVAGQRQILMPMVDGEARHKIARDHSWHLVTPHEAVGGTISQDFVHRRSGDSRSNTEPHHLRHQRNFSHDLQVIQQLHHMTGTDRTDMDDVRRHA